MNINFFLKALNEHTGTSASSHHLRTQKHKHKDTRGHQILTSHCPRYLFKAVTAPSFWDMTSCLTMWTKQTNKQRKTQVSWGTPSILISRCTRKSGRAQHRPSQLVFSKSKSWHVHGNLSANLAGKKKKSSSDISREFYLSLKTFLEPHQWQEIPFKPSLQLCHIY